MKAIVIDRFGDEDVLECRDIEAPVPQTGELLIRVAACGVGFGDIMLRKGNYPAPRSFPITLGFDACGIVEAVGDSVPEAWVGRRVMIAAPYCHADLVACPVSFAAPLPDEVSDEAAACATNYATAYHLLHTINRVESGQSMLVYAAAGGVGSALVQLGKVAGLRVIGLTSTSAKCDFVLEQGADHVINYKTEDVAGEISRITSGQGIDIILNSVSGDTLSRDFEVAAPLGQVTLLGMSAGPPTPDMMGQFLIRFAKSIRLQLFSLGTLAMNKPEAIAESLKALVELIAEGRIKPQIQEVLPLADVARAHRLIEAGQVMGKVILKP